MLKMCIQRLRFAQDKQQALAKQSRRAVAQLLSEGKEQKAHYRVESLIGDDIHVELLEILELYCELLHARITVLLSIADEADLIANHIDDGINEAARAVAFAALHASEIKELGQVKDLLTYRFGQDFLRAIVDDRVGVPDKVVSKCSPGLAKPELVVLYLKEIARTYGVPYSQLEDSDEEEGSGEEEVSGEEEGSGDGDDNDDGEGGEKEKARSGETTSKNGKPILAVDSDEVGDKDHPITVKQPRRNSETVDKQLKIPSAIKKDVKVVRKKASVGGDDELEELKKRFAALRR